MSSQPTSSLGKLASHWVAMTMAVLAVLMSAPRCAGEQLEATSLEFGVSVEDAERVVGEAASPHPLISPSGAIMVLQVPGLEFHFGRGGLEKITWKQLCDGELVIAPFAAPRFNPPVSEERPLDCTVRIEDFRRLVDEWTKRLEWAGYAESQVSRSPGPRKFLARYNESEQRHWYQIEIGPIEKREDSSFEGGALWFFEFSSAGVLQTISAVDLTRNEAVVELRQAVEYAVRSGVKIDTKITLPIF